MTGSADMADRGARRAEDMAKASRIDDTVMSLGLLPASPRYATTMTLIGAAACGDPPNAGQAAPSGCAAGPRLPQKQQKIRAKSRVSDLTASLAKCRGRLIEERISRMVTCTCHLAPSPHAARCDIPVALLDRRSVSLVRGPGARRPASSRPLKPPTRPGQPEEMRNFFVSRLRSDWSRNRIEGQVLLGPFQYSPVRVSTHTRSPVSMNGGTRTLTPSPTPRPSSGSWP